MDDIHGLLVPRMRLFSAFVLIGSMAWATWSMEMGTAWRWVMAGYHLDLVKRRVRDLEWMRDAFRHRADMAEADG